MGWCFIMIIDLIIVGFACISVAAFVGTKDKKQDIGIEQIDETNI